MFVFQADDEAFCAKIEEYYFMGVADTKMARMLKDGFGLSKAPRYVIPLLWNFIILLFFHLVPKPSSAGERHSD